MVDSSARIAAVLNHLEARKLIARTPDPEDSRQIMASLTESGMRLIEEKRAEVVDIVAVMLEKLGPEDARTYLRLQEKILHGFVR